VRYLGALLLVGLLAAAPAFGDAAHLIVPGEGIGSVRLGDPVGRAIAVLGRPRASALVWAPSVQLREYRWYSDASSGSPSAASSGFAVTCLPDGRMTQVSIRYDPAYATPKHLHTSGPNNVRGSSLLDVTLAMGEPGTFTAGANGMRRFEYAGIWFWISTTTQQVARIDVF